MIDNERFIKIDLHIHTKNSIKDSENFEFDQENLTKYIKTNNIKVIAITNHDLFDKTQFLSIQKSLKEIEEIDVLLLPGIEISIEGTHILLITDENMIDDLSKSSEELGKHILADNSEITFETFKELFTNFSKEKSIIIPHYKKTPNIKGELLEKFRENWEEIKLGEVSSIKKFDLQKNIFEQNKKIKPVIFSDLRISRDKDINNGKFTYIDKDFKDVDSFDKFSKFIKDTNNTLYHSPSLEKDIFFLANSKTFLSKGVNLLIGGRASGKSYILEDLNKLENNERENNERENIKITYLKQFEISEQSKNLLDNKKHSYKNNELDDFKLKFENEVLSPLAKLVTMIINNKLIKNDQIPNDVLEKYLEDLKKYSKTYNNDSYKKLPIYNTSEKSNENSEKKEIKKIIDSFKNIKQTNSQDIINILEKYKFKENFMDLVEKEIKPLYKKAIKNDHVIIYFNKIASEIKTEINKISQTTNIPDNLEICEIAKYIILKNKFDSLLPTNEKIISKKTIAKKFKVEIFISKFKNVSELKSYLNTKHGDKITGSFDPFYKKGEYFEYIKKLSKNHNIKTDLFKTLFKLDLNIKTINDQDLSGGERSEFYLLNKIQKGLESDYLLIDEPESSFDNPFLVETLSKMFKEKSENTTIVLTTHSNTLSDSFNNDWIIYSEPSKKRYSGRNNDKQLKSFDGEEISSYDAIMKTLEAGEKSYLNRGKNYKSLKEV